MRIKENICPRCGGPSPDGGTCARCRVDQIRWMECDSRISVIECPSCGAWKEAGAWTDLNRERTDIATERILRAIHLHPGVESPGFDMRIEDISPNRSRASCTVSASLLGIPVQESCSIEIVWQKEQCDRCSRMSGSYYEGVVQVRAKGRKPYPFEIATAAGIAQETEGALQEGGERLSFISRIDENRDGLDITVGSQRIGQEISSNIVRRLGGRFSTHPKLVGEKAGRKVYRITFSVRLPKYTREDIIIHGGRYAEVIAVDKDNVRIRDLFSGAIRTVKDSAVERLIGNLRDAECVMIAFRDGDMIGVLEPASGKTIECQVHPSSPLCAGQEIRIMRDGIDLIVIG